MNRIAVIGGGLWPAAICLVWPRPNVADDVAYRSTPSISSASSLLPFDGDVPYGTLTVLGYGMDASRIFVSLS